MTGMFDVFLFLYRESEYEIPVTKEIFRWEMIRAKFSSAKGAKFIKKTLINNKMKEG